MADPLLAFGRLTGTLRMRSTSAQVKTDAEALCGGKDSTMYLLGSGLEIHRLQSNALATALRLRTLSSDKRCLKRAVLAPDRDG